MKKFIIAFVLLSLVFLFGCGNNREEDYNSYAEYSVNWLYDTISDHSQFEIHNIQMIDDTTTGFLFYTIDFQSLYNSYTEEGIILTQATLLVIIQSENPFVVSKFNIKDKEKHETLYSQYESAVASTTNFTYDFSDTEIQSLIESAAIE